MHTASLLTSLAAAALIGLISNVEAQVPSVSEVENCDTQWTQCNEAYITALVAAVENSTTTTYTCQTDYENCILGSSVPAVSSTAVANSSVTATIPTVNATSSIAIPTSTLNATSSIVVPTSTLNATSIAIPSSTLNATSVLSSVISSVVSSLTDSSTITGTAVSSSSTTTLGARQVNIDQITQCDTQWETCNENYLNALANAVTAGTAQAEVVSYTCQTDYESCIAGSSVVGNATATTAVSASALPTSNTTVVVPTATLNTTAVIPTVTGNVTATVASSSGISVPSITGTVTGITSSEVIPGASSVVSSASESVDTATDISIPTGVGISGRWVPANRR